MKSPILHAHTKHIEIKDCFIKKGSHAIDLIIKYIPTSKS
jgi:hypothetical protein